MKLQAITHAYGHRLADVHSSGFAPANRQMPIASVVVRYSYNRFLEGNTGKPIEFQKSFGKSGDNPHWLTRGSRWRPSELS